MPPIKEIWEKLHTWMPPNKKCKIVHTCMPPQNKSAPKVKNKFAPNPKCPQKVHTCIPTLDKNAPK